MTRTLCVPITVLLLFVWSKTAAPELSGIVLSLVDRTGNPVDGYLRLHEIFNLHLAADLVVLSACQTALGKDIKGEGLIGLTRGFMYAGTPSVLASLWKINDVATAELMTRFYRGVLKENFNPLLRSAPLRSRCSSRSAGNHHITGPRFSCRVIGNNCWPGLTATR